MLASPMLGPPLPLPPSAWWYQVPMGGKGRGGDGRLPICQFSRRTPADRLYGVV